MITGREAAKQVSILVPKLMSWSKNSFLVSSNVTTSQIISLMNMHELKRCTISQLAKALGVSLPTTSGIVDRLVKAKYLKRLYDEKDRRLILISLTNKGEAIVEKFLETIRERWEKILERLTETERDSYVTILKKLTNIISEQTREEIKR